MTMMDNMFSTFSPSWAAWGLAIRYEHVDLASSPCGNLWIGIYMITMGQRMWILEKETSLRPPCG